MILKALQEKPQRGWQLIGNPDATFENVVKHSLVIDCVRKGLEAHNAAAGGASSLRIGRALLEPFRF